MNVDCMLDRKSDCISSIFKIPLGEYLRLIDIAYNDEGGIIGQRTKLTSKSGKRIRDQMTSDFSNGAVLPPVVLGMVDTELEIDSENLQFKTVEGILGYLNNRQSKICIIDGMQRTTAMMESLKISSEVGVKEIRIELWVAKSISKLIYRMMVLNTGQVPWTMKRQLEVVMRPMLNYIQESVDNIHLISSNDDVRRSAPGIFQSNKIIESFLVFGTRSEKVNSSDMVSEEYIKIDFIEASSKSELLSTYTKVLTRFIKLDFILSKTSENSALPRFKKGDNLFSSQPFLIGITTAFAQKILGRPKVDYAPEKQAQNLLKILDGFDTFLSKVDEMNSAELDRFLNLDELNLLLPAKSSSRVGDLERAYFRDAFITLINEDFQVDDMIICWGN